VLVKVNPKPAVDAGPDQILNLDEPMYLNAMGTGTLTWIAGEGILCRACPNSQITPSNSSVYVIEAVNQYGCKATDEMHVEVTKDHNVYIPNIFTPNFDGKNDVFLVYGTGITKLEMVIFDRWGEKLFTSTDQLKGWDGTYKGVLSKNDSYVYLINYTSLDGKKHTKTGHVSLLK
jgi:gliding motility-associated-like protein